MEHLKRLAISPVLIASLLLVALTGMVREGIAITRTLDHNKAIAAPERIKVGDDAHPALIFAKAFGLQQSGDPLEAIRLYGAILQNGDAHFRARVRYNLGTLYLRDAAKLWKDQGLLDYVRINTLLSAAKDNLRESLSLEPAQWDARYNLEYAFRITPPPKEKPKTDFQGSKSSVFATLPALPGGGP